MVRGTPYLLLAALCLGAVAVAWSTEEGRRSEPASGPPLPRRGGTYRAPLADDPPTFDPAMAADTTSFSLCLQIYDGLVRFQEVGADVAPGLAERWEIAPDGLTYTFHLRKGVRFVGRPGSEPVLGRPLTAADVKYSFERVIDPRTKSPASTMFEPIAGSGDVTTGKTRDLAGIEVLDEHTVRIRLQAPFAPFLASLTMPNAFIVQREAIEAIEARRAKGREVVEPVGTGPFRLLDYQPGNRVVLVRNESYWDQTPGLPARPYLDRLVFEIERNEEKRFRRWEQGELHHSEVPDPVYEKYAGDPNFTKINQLGTYYLGFQVQAPPFNDLRVRRAFAHAIDKASMVRYIRAKRVQAARGPLPPNIPGYNASLRSYEYDPEAAEKLLDEAGFPRDPATGLRSGFPATALDIDTDDSNLRLARAVQANLLDVGIPIAVARRPWAEHLERVRAGRSPFHRLGWVADYLDADSFLYYNFFSGNIGASNGNYYQNRDVDRLLQEAREVSNPDRRLKLYAKAEQIIAEDSPWICIFYYQSCLLRRPFVHGLSLTALGTHMIRYDGVWLASEPVKSPEGAPPEP